MPISIIPVPIDKDVTKGEDLVALVIDSLRKRRIGLKDGDILAITHKIVSKAEGRIVNLASVKPSRRAQNIARKHKKDPRIVELILNEAKEIVKVERGIIIVETKHGFVCANGGVDQSNVKGGCVSLLPVNPDKSADRIRRKFEKRENVRIGVIISDTFGRPFRTGQINVAIGASGFKTLVDYRGQKDHFGKELKVTEIAIADELAGAAELVMGKLDHVPVAIIRGFKPQKGKDSAASLIRKPEDDLFR